MINRKSKLFVFVLFFLSAAYGYTKEIKSSIKHPFYAGFIAGYGSTTWEGLVPEKKNQNEALMLSTPKSVNEGGTTWGLLAGYEFSRFFALEANYMRYPDATVKFSPLSIFTFENAGLDALTTKTESVSLMGKIMLEIPRSEVRVFSSAGIASLYRKDMIVDDWRLTPTFGVGLNYPFTEHIMGEIVGNYTAGFGESLLSPADTYFPFLYSITAHLSYRF